MNASRDYFSQSMTLLGTVGAVDPASGCFELRCRSGDTVQVQVDAQTTFTALRNIDGLDRDRLSEPPECGKLEDSTARTACKYVRSGRLLALGGIYLEHNGNCRFDAHTVTALHNHRGNFLFEETHWWLTQISRFADEWLDDLFQDKRTYNWDDFAALYRTNLNILGEPTDDHVQECATLSRLIYGLSSAYLLTGSHRYLLAAEAGVKYQSETFRSLSHDGQYCFWIFGKRKRDRGAVLVVPSENEEDRESIPLYEQIYALAGLCQYYRITQDWQVLEDIRRTLRAFNYFYRDKAPNYASDSEQRYASDSGGYFSHIDYATLRADSPRLQNDKADNRLRKNWNSIGDHIPAYLVNLILALEPLPRGAWDDEAPEDLLRWAKDMLWETSELIVTHFAGTDSPFVNERFHADWSPDHRWFWQQNRAIVGHNFKIAWNLTRVANYFEGELLKVDNVDAKHSWRAPEQLKEHIRRLRSCAEQLTADMTRLGIDQHRGGCFDAVERKVGDNIPIKFVWGNTKDFWQQEQAILAYLIMAGATDDKHARTEYKNLAREMMAFWNLYFLDLDNRGVFFRVTESGMPVIQGAYAQKAGHAIAGYHSFELNYLAHLYIRTFLSAEESDIALFRANLHEVSVVQAKGHDVNSKNELAHAAASSATSGEQTRSGPAKTLTDSRDVSGQENAEPSRNEGQRPGRNFCLFFHPNATCPYNTINVLPDFLPPGSVTIHSITINGVRKTSFDKANFQIELLPSQLGTTIVVEFSPFTSGEPRA